MMESIYLDYAATTPILPEVSAVIEEAHRRYWGNPSSSHRLGREAKQALESARATVADAIHAKESEIIFTSGGTESDFLALSGILLASTKRHLITTSVEHHAILHNATALHADHVETTLVSPSNDVATWITQLELALRHDTGLVSIMWVNNETGAVFPISQIAAFLFERQIPLHTDAVQALGTFSIDVRKDSVSALSLTAHKIFGPVGIGALYVREGTSFQPRIRGGKQEKNRRAGTENVPLILGFAKAVELCTASREAHFQKLLALRTAFLTNLQAALTGISDHSASEQAPHILNIGFEGVDNEALLMLLDLSGVFASAGSACSAGAIEPSHVLVALGYEQQEIRSSVRFSFSPYQSLEEIIEASRVVIRTVQQLRK